jgi:hypothetical protein
VSVPKPVLSTDTGPIIVAIVGALLAALGYVGKLVAEGLREWRRERARRITRLLQLQALLRASKTAFDVQNELAIRLHDRLREKHPDAAQAGEGFEDFFSRLHHDFDPEDADLHGVIRGYTEHALHPLNEAILAWLSGDVDHRAKRGKRGYEADLAVLLNALDAHVRLWLAKYESWLPNRPDHALVYLDDEKRHGLGFPAGLDRTLEAVLSAKT